MLGQSLYVRLGVDHTNQLATVLGDESERMQHLLYLWFYVYTWPQVRWTTFTDEEVDEIHSIIDGLRIRR
jgi:hypothetical protein